jgi:hypothetical protein
MAVKEIQYNLNDNVTQHDDQELESHISSKKKNKKKTSNLHIINNFLNIIDHPVFI